MTKEIWYKDSDNSSGNIIAEVLGDDLYLLKESALFSKRFLYGVKVKATLKEDDKIWIDEILDYTEFRTECLILNDETIYSDIMKLLINKLNDLGGTCDRSMGGVLNLYIPRSSDFDITKEIEKIKNTL